MFTGIIIGVAVLAAAIIYFEIRAPYIKRKTAPLVQSAADLAATGKQAVTEIKQTAAEVKTAVDAAKGA